MIGEFNFDDIFHIEDEVSGPGTKPLLLYPQMSYGLFVGFLVLMSIIIVNLLVGLAVDDIKAVQEKAKLKRLAMQVLLLPVLQWACIFTCEHKCSQVLKLLCCCCLGGFSAILVSMTHTHHIESK